MEPIFRAVVFGAHGTLPLLLVGILCALAFVAMLLVDKWYPSGRFMGHPEAIFRSVVFGALAFVAMLLIDNWYLKGIIFLVIAIVGWRISRELLTEIIARLLVIALERTPIKLYHVRRRRS